MPSFYTNVRRMGLPVLLVLITLLAVLPGWAWPPTYGAEFEITRIGLGKFNFAEGNPTESDEKKEQMRFVEHMKERCLVSDCKIVEVRGKWDKDYRIEYKDGWWFKVSYDPNCVEITFKPSSIEEMRKQAARINDQIFETGKQVGLDVTKPNNSHFNMGVNSAFNGDAKLFLRYFTDYANHPDLGMGSLGRDPYNAPPLAILGEDQRAALNLIVEKVNSGKLTTVNEVASEIQNKVYTRSYYAPWGGADHYQAVGLKYVNRTDLNTKDAPMEIRAVWIQDSAEQFIKVSELMEGRINYLKRSSDPILYIASDKKAFSQKEMLTRFAIYVEEAGLNYEDFKKLLPKDLSRLTFDDLVRTEASPQSRLQRVEAYWDLLPASEWLRKLVADLLIHPDNKNTELAEKILQRLTESAYNPKKPWHSFVTGAKAPPSLPPEIARGYQNALDEIAFKKQHRSSQAPQAWGIGSGKMCGGILF